MESQSSEEEKSKNEENDSEYESNYIEIKKEKPNMIYLENKIYRKLISQIEKYNEMINNIKTNFNLSKANSKVEFFPDTNNIKYEKILKEKDNSINLLRIENESKQKEIISLQSINHELEQKYNDIMLKYEKEIKEKNDIINSLENELKILNDRTNILNEIKSEQKIEKNINDIEQKILMNEKIIEMISNFLPLEDKLKLFSLNKTINFCFKYKNRYHTNFKN